MVARKYTPEESALSPEISATKKEESSMMPAWAFPLFGVVAMFSFASFLAIRVRRGERSSRRIQVVQPLSQTEDEVSFLSDDSAVE